MHVAAKVIKYRVSDDGTDLLLRISGQQLDYMFTDKQCRTAEVRLDDGRLISADQRKKAYATIRDISVYTGYLPEVQKEWLKYLHISRTGSRYFSLSDCTMDEAREFINTILEYAIENGVQLTDTGINRTDDIGKYLYYCIKHRKCAVCGQDGEVHHVDAIGMGNDRHKVDDSDYRKICLCRKHHTIAHQGGMPAFERMYHVYGIVFKDDDCADAQKEGDTSEPQGGSRKAV